MYCHDSEGVKHQLMLIVDFSSSYHVVVAVSRKDTYHLERAFCEYWLNVFGAPKVLAIDVETGLEKSLSRVGDYTGTKLRHAAGQARWQAGCTERQGTLWNTIFAKISDEMAITKGELLLAIGAVSSAKNNLIKTSGYSPAQHVFGSTANIPEDLINGRRAFGLGDEPVIDDSHAREVAIQTSARVAFHQVQTDERVRRALLGRTRVSQRRPEVGEQVFYWRKPATSKNGRWIGPAALPSGRPRRPRTPSPSRRRTGRGLQRGRRGHRGLRGGGRRGDGRARGRGRRSTSWQTTSAHRSGGSVRCRHSS